MAAGNTEVRCADNTSPVVALLLLLLDPLLHLSVGQSKALLLVVAEASLEFITTAAIFVIFLENLVRSVVTYLRTL